MATLSLETPRLILRPLALEDADEVQLIFPQWEIVRHLNGRVPWPFPPDGVRTYYLDSALPAIERGDEYHWMLLRKDDPERKIIGSICLVLSGPVNRGFWIAPLWQNRGLMTEAVQAVNRFWFEELKQPVLRTKKACENLASRAISVREGMRCVDHTEDDYVSGRLPTEHWELTAEDWQIRNSGGLDPHDENQRQRFRGTCH